MSDIRIETIIDMGIDDRQAQAAFKSLTKYSNDFGRAIDEEKKKLKTLQTELKELHGLREAGSKVTATGAQIGPAITRKSRAIEEQQTLVENIGAVQSKLEQQSRLAAASIVSPIKEAQLHVKQATDTFKQMFMQFGAGSQEANEAAKQLQEVNAHLKQIKEEAQVGKNVVQKFFGALSRTSIYMAARRGMLALFGAVKEGVSNFAVADDTMNETLSNIMNSVNQIKNQFGVAFGQLLQAVEPILTTLLNSLSLVAEGASALTASISGKEYYTRAVKGMNSYADSINKTNKQLMSFDKLNIMQEDKMPQYEQVEITGGLSDMGDAFSNIISIARQVFELLNPILKLLGELIEGVLPPLLRMLNIVLIPIKAIIELLVIVIKWILEVIAVVVDWLDKTGLLETALWSLALVATYLAVQQIPAMTIAMIAWIKQTTIAAVSAIPKIIASIKAWALANSSLLINVGALVGVFLILDTIFNNIPDDVRQVVGAITILVASVVAATVAWMAFHGTMSAGVAVPIILGAVGAGIAGIKAMMPAMATGGIVSSPTVAMVGEGRYPEAVVPLGNSPQFRSMKQDIAEAVADIGGSNSGTIHIENKLYLDRRELVAFVEDTVERKIRNDTGRSTRDLGRNV